MASKYTSFLAIVAILAQLGFWAYTFKNVYKRTLLEKEICQVLVPYEGRTLYGFDYDVAVEGRGLNFTYKNMYDAFYDDFKTNDLVLFNPIKVAKQWEGKNPMKNWHRIEQSYQLRVLKSFDDGWNLYQITTE